MLKQGTGKAKALTETQKKFRSHPIPMWLEPYVWSAFQLSGSWGPVSELEFGITLNQLEREVGVRG